MTVRGKEKGEQIKLTCLSDSFKVVVGAEVYLSELSAVTTAGLLRVPFDHLEKRGILGDVVLQRDAYHLSHSSTCFRM